ncbi:unnamed protein product [Spirodela intermedia]|uniref:Uncharacterized protein n=1 Tax=Spirodela intermedia TaxID=51605 RepID=A0A7I8KHQ3_SPIIN|nr:unnamed protein product [Spirodela intermedia]
MVCAGLIGSHGGHRTAGGYALVVLAVAGVALGLRILLFGLARWLQRRRQAAEGRRCLGGGVSAVTCAADGCPLCRCNPLPILPSPPRFPPSWNR